MVLYEINTCRVIWRRSKYIFDLYFFKNICDFTTKIGGIKFTVYTVHQYLFISVNSSLSKTKKSLIYFQLKSPMEITYLPLAMTLSRLYFWGRSFYFLGIIILIAVLSWLQVLFNFSFDSISIKSCLFDTKCNRWRHLILKIEIIWR